MYIPRGRAEALPRREAENATGAAITASKNGEDRGCGCGYFLERILFGLLNINRLKLTKNRGEGAPCLELLINKQTNPHRSEFGRRTHARRLYWPVPGAFSGLSGFTRLFNSNSESRLRFAGCESQTNVTAYGCCS